MHGRQQRKQQNLQEMHSVHTENIHPVRNAPHSLAAHLLYPPKKTQRIQSFCVLAHDKEPRVFLRKISEHLWKEKLGLY